MFIEKPKNIKYEKYDPTKIVVDKELPGPHSYNINPTPKFDDSYKFNIGNSNRFGQPIIKKSKSN